MTSKERVLQRERERGRSAALEFQTASNGMTGTEINAVDDKIPHFTAAIKTKNMMDRKAGDADGFVCRSNSGRVVRLIQNYDNTVYPGDPEVWPAFYRFVWSTDPKKALPFVAISTSPYGEGECCSENGEVYSSVIANNVSAPSAYPAGWKHIGSVAEIIGGE